MFRLYRRSRQLRFLFCAPQRAPRPARPERTTREHNRAARIRFVAREIVGARRRVKTENDDDDVGDRRTMKNGKTKRIRVNGAVRVGRWMTCAMMSRVHAAPVRRPRHVTPGPSAGTAVSVAARTGTRKETTNRKNERSAT